MKYTKIGGIINSTVAAIEAPERAIPPEPIVDITVGKVFSDSLKIVPLGTVDYISRNENRNSVNTQGRTFGKTTLQKVINQSAPSMRAASIIASGT